MIPAHAVAVKNTKNVAVKMLDEIFKKHGVSICYLFGSQKDKALLFLKGKKITIEDPEADIDFAVVFKRPPEEPLKTYALLSLDLQDIVTPYKADLVFLHEVDHLFQLEAIKGHCIYCNDESFREEYEHKVMMFASDELEIFKLNERDFFEAIENGYFQFEYKAD